MLRRQWASKAQLLMATLDELPDADITAVQGKSRATRANNESVSALDKHTPCFSRVKCQMKQSQVVLERREGKFFYDGLE